MDRRSFIRSLLFAGGAVVSGAALLPRDAQAASLFDTLKDIEQTGAPVSGSSEADMPAVGAQDVQFRRRRFMRRRRVCVTRVGPRGRVRRVCRWG